MPNNKSDLFEKRAPNEGWRTMARIPVDNRLTMEMAYRVDDSGAINWAYAYDYADDDADFVWLGIRRNEFRTTARFLSAVAGAFKDIHGCNVLKFARGRLEAEGS